LGVLLKNGLTSYQIFRKESVKGTPKRGRCQLIGNTLCPKRGSLTIVMVFGIPVLRSFGNHCLSILIATKTPQ
jgi:hypothetical protein